MNSPSETMTIPETKAVELLGGQDHFGVPVMQFTRVTDYTTFTAEHASDGNDLIFHFFKTEENASHDYWRRVFPNALQDIAQEVFDSTFPRLKAAFTPEMDSWWFRANGFVNVGDPEARIRYFFEKLDQALEARKVIHRTE